MDIATLLAGWKDPAVVLAFIVGLAITVKFLSSKLKVTEETVSNIRDNHLVHIGESLVRIETKLEDVPCMRNDDKSCPSGFEK